MTTSPRARHLALALGLLVPSTASAQSSPPPSAPLVIPSVLPPLPAILPPLGPLQVPTGSSSSTPPPEKRPAPAKRPPAERPAKRTPAGGCPCPPSIVPSLPHLVGQVLPQLLPPMLQAPVSKTEPPQPASPAKRADTRSRLPGAKPVPLPVHEEAPTPPR